MIEFSFSGQRFRTGRIIGSRGNQTGPLIVFVGGIHGNEPTGVIALIRVFEELAAGDVELAGQVIGLVGNLTALTENRRFVWQDLNRIWDRSFARQSDKTQNANNGEFVEQKERRELFGMIEPLLSLDRPLFFVDLHTTSSASVPFVAINDQLDNRKFALNFPVPTVLGIEEYLQGPLLSFLNDFGHVALAFEAGQHDDPESIEIHKSFVYLAMLAANVIRADQIPDFQMHQSRLENCGRSNRGFYEVLFRKAIDQSDRFVMNPGYRNFTPIRNGEVLAQDLRGEIRAHRSGRIFMPLYQAAGEDGFFIVRKIPRWTLRLSSVLRRLNFEKFLLCLPGITRSPDQTDALVVNKKIARFLANDLFHLLGYRRKRDDGNVMTFTRREVGNPLSREQSG